MADSGRYLRYVALDEQAAGSGYPFDLPAVAGLVHGRVVRPRRRGPREQPADPRLRLLWGTHPRSTSPRPTQTVASLSFGATSWVLTASVAFLQPRSHYLNRGNYTYAALRRGVVLITAATGERESP